MVDTKAAVDKMLGGDKRKCKTCGKVHKGMPFTDCYNEKTDGPLPDDLQDYYKRKFGDN